MSEADIRIGDTKLTDEQSMVLRVAVNCFLIDIQESLDPGSEDPVVQAYNSHAKTLREIHDIISLRIRRAAR